MHESTEYFVQTQQILSAFVSGLSSKIDIKPKSGTRGAPHEVLFLVFAYLDVPELLVMSEACKLLRDAANKDVLSWRDIIIEKPLNSRL